MLCWTRKVWGIRWIVSKVKIIGKEPMKSTQFLYCAMMIKHTSKTMDMMEQLLAIKVSCIKNIYFDSYFDSYLFW